MDKFGPETVARIECGKCNTSELVRLGDLPRTPGKLFMLPITAQCITCLSVVSCEILDEDQEGDN